MIIIGGGAVASDCAMKAIKLGATTVEIFTRKNIGDIQLPENEFNEVIKNKININAKLKINDIEIKNGKIKKVTFIKLDEKVNEIKDSYQTRTDIDLIILAIKNIPLINIKDKKGLFFCGDFKIGASTVVECVANGKNTAMEVDAYLNNKKIKIDDNKKSRFILKGRNMIKSDISIDFFGYKMKSPFMISASPHSDGFEQVKTAYEKGWSGVIMKTAFDNLHIHIPSQYMFFFDKSTYGNCDTSD